METRRKCDKEGRQTASRRAALFEPVLDGDYLIVIVTDRPMLLSCRPFRLTDTFVIGRDPSCDLILEGCDGSVSRKHCQLTRMNGRRILSDLCSSNGTAVNSTAIRTPQVLRSGDKIQIGETVLKYFVSSDVETRNYNEIFRKLHEDTLTGLPNWNVLEPTLKSAIVQSQSGARSLAVAKVDVNRFHRINRDYGSEAADSILREVGRRLAAVVRSGDTLGRYEGDKFLMILPDCDGASVEAVGQRVLRAVAEAYTTDAQPAIWLTFAIGVVEHDRTWDANRLLVALEQATNTAKQGDGSQIVTRLVAQVPSSEAGEVAWNRLTTPPGLAECVADKSFVEMALHGDGLAVAGLAIVDNHVSQELGPGAYDRWFEELLREARKTVVRTGFCSRFNSQVVLMAAPPEELARAVAETKGRWEQRAGQPLDAAARAARPRAAGVRRLAKDVVLMPDEVRSRGVLVTDEIRRRLALACGEHDLSVVGRLPWPLAAPRARLDSLAEASERTLSAAVSIECALKYVVAIELALLREVKDTEVKQRLARILDKKHAHPLGMKIWAVLFRELTALLPRASGQLAQFLSSFADTEGERSGLCSRIERLIEPRNSQAHGFTRAKGYYEELEPTQTEVLDDLLVALRPLGRHELVALSRIDGFGTSPDVVSYSLHLLQGTADHFKIIKKDLRQKLVPQWCYLMMEDGRALNLAPLIQFSYCRTCQCNEIFTAKGLPHPTRPVTGDFTGVLSGHSIQVPIDPWEY